jgi:transcriptional regulator with GAF, ATPase, and Fis domain
MRGPYRKTARPYRGHDRPEALCKHGRAPAKPDRTSSNRHVARAGRGARDRTPTREVDVDPRWSASPWTHVLLDTWRHVSEHLDLGASMEALRARLGSAIGVRALVAWRWDPLTSVLEVAAASPWDAAPDAARRLTGSAAAPVRAWLAADAPGPLPGPVTAALGLDGARRWFGAPLLEPDGPGGLVAFGDVDDPEDAASLLDALRPALRAALRNDGRVQELARLREAVEAENRALLVRLGRDDLGSTLVGANGGLRDLVARLDQVGPTDAPVLLLGETGTGKELVARALHQRSNRARGPFLKVNCGAIPPELIDSELFGHERGSFTGAVATRVGWFERAAGGTLFLDEIGELPLAAQVRLLRVLQDGGFERVGGQRPLRADVRVVAATHRDLRRMVAEGRFRDDLWYRIGTFPLRIPPLRERTGDLPSLVAHFAARSGTRLFGRPLVPDEDDIRRLAAYAWPGNVRELGAVLERAAILGDGRRLEVRAALGVQAETAPTHPTPGVDPAPQAPHAPPAPDRHDLLPMDAAAREVVLAVLRTCRGRVDGPRGAAKRLGIPASTLRSRMQRLGIDARAYRPD